LIDYGLAGRADFCGELLLTKAEPVPQANDHRGVIRRYGHTAYCHATTSAPAIGPAISLRHELTGGLSRGRRSELAEECTRAERRCQAPIVRSSAQRPHMHVEFVGQDLKRHSVMRRPLRVQSSCLADDGLRCGPSAGIPRAERFEGDAQSRRTFRL
jgi:hypothetical protein